MHRSSVGSTTEQPERVGVAMHWESVGSTEEQPLNVGVAIHCASVGGGGGLLFEDSEGVGNTVEPALMTIPSPAQRLTEPCVLTTAPDEIVKMSPAPCTPLEPAVSEILPVFDITVPMIVNGL